MTLRMIKIPYLENNRVIPEARDFRMPGAVQSIPQRETDELNERLREVTDEERVRRYYHEEEFIETNKSGEKQIVKRLVPNDGEEIYCR